MFGDLCTCRLVCIWIECKLQRSLPAICLNLPEDLHDVLYLIFVGIVHAIFDHVPWLGLVSEAWCRRWCLENWLCLETWLWCCRWEECWKQRACRLWYEPNCMAYRRQWLAVLISWPHLGLILWRWRDMILSIVLDAWFLLLL